MARVHDVDPGLIDRTRALAARPAQRRRLVGARGPRARTRTRPAAATAGPAGDDRVHRLGRLRRRRPATRRPADAGLPAAHAAAVDRRPVRPGPGRQRPAGPRPEGHGARRRTSTGSTRSKQTSEDGKLAWWEQPAGAADARSTAAGRAGGVETTALAALALLAAGREPETTRGGPGLAGRPEGRPGTWHSTQATVLALKALLAGTGKPLAATAAADRRRPRRRARPRDRRSPPTRPT